MQSWKCRSHLNDAAKVLPREALMCRHSGEGRNDGTGINQRFPSAKQHQASATLPVFTH